MAQVKKVDLECDLSGKHEGDIGTHQVTLDGEGGELEMCEGHFDRLHTSMTGVLLRCRKVSASQSRAKRRNMATRRHTAAVRAWAVREGLLEEGSKGRIPTSVNEKYEAR